MAEGSDILTEAADIIGGSKHVEHGDAHLLYTAVAHMWQDYLSLLGDRDMTATDVMNMMVVLKMCRTKHGKWNKDDWLDMCGYAGLSWENELKRLK